MGAPKDAEGLDPMGVVHLGCCLHALGQGEPLPSEAGFLPEAWAKSVRAIAERLGQVEALRERLQQEQGGRIAAQEALRAR